MRTLRHKKLKKTKVKRSRKARVMRKARKTKARKTKVRRHRVRKTKRMKGGDKALAKIFNINFGSPENTLSGLEADVYSVEHSPAKPIPKAPGMNVGQPNNSPYTGYGWYKN